MCSQGDPRELEGRYKACTPYTCAGEPTKLFGDTLKLSSTPYGPKGNKQPLPPLAWPAGWVPPSGVAEGGVYVTPPLLATQKIGVYSPPFWPSLLGGTEAVP